MSKGYNLAGNRCHGYRQFHKSLNASHMKVNRKKIVVIRTGVEGRQINASSRDLGVNTQWVAWRCPCSTQACGHVQAVHEQSSYARITGAQ
eukprot:1350860-Amphidinium_carterae.1